MTIVNHTVDVLEGDNVTVGCIPDGFPSPNIFWVNGSNGTIATGQVLHLPNIKWNHGGVYTCFANNTCGSDSKNVDTVVQCELCGKKIAPMTNAYM